jgi:hypothetical protein
MEHQGVPTMIGSLGVGLLLLAFFLNIFKFLRSEAYVYIVLNLVGGALALLLVSDPLHALRGAGGHLVGSRRRCSHPESARAAGRIEARLALKKQLQPSRKVASEPHTEESVWRSKLRQTKAVASSASYRTPRACLWSAQACSEPYTRVVPRLRRSESAFVAVPAVRP